MKPTLSETEVTQMQDRFRKAQITDIKRKAGMKVETPSQKSKRIVAEVKAAESASKRRTKSATTSVKAAPAVEIAAAAPAGPYGLVVNEGLTIMFRVVAFNGDSALGKLVFGNGQEPPAGAPLSFFNIKARNVTLFETLEDSLAYAEREGITIVGRGTGDEVKAEIKGILADHALKSLATK